MAGSYLRGTGERWPARGADLVRLSDRGAAELRHHRKN
jgi:hypothetical protein